MTDYKITHEESIILNAMKAISMLLVLLIHADLRECAIIHTPMVDFYNYFFCRIFPNAAVPIFFFLSGFFLYKGFDYRTKLKSRIHTIIIPYILWCLWGLCIIFILQKVLGLESMFSGNKLKLLCDFTAVDYLRIFWDVRDGAPIISTLWFLRDLSVLIVLSPIIFKIINSVVGYVFIGFIFILYIVGIKTNITLGISPIFFFSLGGFVMLRNLDIFSFFRRNKKLVIIVNLLALIGSSICYLLDAYAMHGLVERIYILTCIPMLYIICSNKVIYQSKILKRFQEASFFIYLFHEPWLGYMQKCTFRFMELPAWTPYILMWILPIFILIFSYVLFKTLQKICPTFLGIIIGKRNNQ